MTGNADIDCSGDQYASVISAFARLGRYTATHWTSCHLSRRQESSAPGLDLCSTASCSSHNSGPGFAPVGYAELSGSERTKNFFEVYLAAPVVIAFYIGFKIWKRSSVRRLKDIDIVSGRREIDLDQILADERAARASWPMRKKVWKTVC
jgi:hypothetical protein